MGPGVRKSQMDTCLLHDFSIGALVSKVSQILCTFEPLVFLSQSRLVVVSGLLNDKSRKMSMDHLGCVYQSIYGMYTDF